MMNRVNEAVTPSVFCECSLRKNRLLHAAQWSILIRKCAKQNSNLDSRYRSSNFLQFCTIEIHLHIICPTLKVSSSTITKNQC